MLTEAQKAKALDSLNQLSEIAKSLTGEKVEEDKEKNPLRKSLDSVLGTMEKLVKGEGDGGEAGAAGGEGGEGAAGGEGGEAGAAGGEGGEAGGDGGEAGAAGGEGGEAGGEGGEATEKSLKDTNDIVKSLKEQDADFVEAYESSELVKSLCTAINNQNKAIDKINGQMANLSKSITAIEKNQGEFHKSFAEVKKAEAALIKSVHENVEKIGGQPLPRKSAQPTDASPLEKSFMDSEKLNGQGQPGESDGVTHTAKVDALSKAIESGDGRISLQEATQFELTAKVTPGVKAVLTEAKLMA